MDSALQRAHRSVDARLPERSQQATLRSLDDGELKQVVEGYVQAWERADVDAMVSMLARDAVIAMPPEPNWFAGRDAIGAFLAEHPFAPDVHMRVLPTWSNGQLAFAHYIWREEAGAYLRHVISVLSLRGPEIAEMVVFRTRRRSRASTCRSGSRLRPAVPPDPGPQATSGSARLAGSYASVPRYRNTGWRSPAAAG